MMPEAKDVNKWLDITEQQLDILKIIYKTQQNRKTTPKEITREYKRIHGKNILKPNLFPILKLLTKRGFIYKAGQADYKVEIKGINEALEDKRKVLDKQQAEFEQACRDTEEYFRKLTWQMDRPIVEYLSHDELYQKMAAMLEETETFNVIANFPMIAYTRKINHGLVRETYTDALWKRCLKKRELNVNYLTDLNVDYLFNHAFRVYGDPKPAYRECQTVINQLENQTETTPNLDIRYLEDPHGLDTGIFQRRGRDPDELIIFVRDEHEDITGGLHIKNQDTARNAYKMFDRNFEYAEKLTGKAGKETLARTRETLKQKYGILGE